MSYADIEVSDYVNKQISPWPNCVDTKAGMDFRSSCLP